MNLTISVSVFDSVQVTNFLALKWVVRSCKDFLWQHWGSWAAPRGFFRIKVNALFSPRDQATLLLVHLVELKCYSEVFNAYLTYLMYFISCFLTVTKLTNTLWYEKAPVQSQWWEIRICCCSGARFFCLLVFWALHNCWEFWSSEHWGNSGQETVFVCK